MRRPKAALGAAVGSEPSPKPLPHPRGWRHEIGVSSLTFFSLFCGKGDHHPSQRNPPEQHFPYFLAPKLLPGRFITPGQTTGTLSAPSSLGADNALCLDPAAVPELILPPKKRATEAVRKTMKCLFPPGITPCCWGAGPSRTPNHPQQGDRVPLGHPMQSELSKPSGLRVTAAPGEGEGGFEEGFWGSGGSPEAVLGLFLALGQPGDFSAHIGGFPGGSVLERGAARCPPPQRGAA